MANCGNIGKNTARNDLYETMNLLEARYPTILAVGILLAGLSAFGSASANEQGTTSYKWTDDKGVLHYGDRVPPEHAKRERSRLNEQGVEVGRFEAEKTFEQLAEEERRTEEARRVASHDVFLRTTYASVREIERLRDQRLQQLRDQRLSTEGYVASLNSRLGQLRVRAQKFSPYTDSPDARRMPYQMAEEIVRNLREVERQHNLLAERRATETALRAQFQSDIDRDQQLRAGNPRR